MFQEVKTLNVSFKWKVKVRRITAGQETISWSQTQRRLDWLLTYQTELQHKELWLASSSWLWGVWPIRFLPAAALQEGLELNHWSSVKCAHLYLIIIFGLNTGKKTKKTGSLVAQISELTSCPADKVCRCRRNRLRSGLLPVTSRRLCSISWW